MPATPQHKELFGLLKEASQLTGRLSGGYSGQFSSVEEFRERLGKCIVTLKAGQLQEIGNLYNWFLPTADWDDLTGGRGQDLGNSIFILLSDIVSEAKDESLESIIREYQAAAAKVINVFETKYGRTDLLGACRSDKLFPPRGDIEELGIKRYAIHGTGLWAIFDDGSSVDFDFGYTGELRHDGFDLYRLGKFILERPWKYCKYFDKTLLEKDFKALIEKKTIALPDASFKTSLYFFSDSLKKPVEKKEAVKNKSWWKFWNK